MSIRVLSRAQLGQIKKHPWYRRFVALLGVVFLLTVVQGFVAAAKTAPRGDSTHQWLGLVVVVGMVGHFLLHWDWILRALSRRPSGRARTDSIIDLLLVLLLVAVLASGLGMGGLLDGHWARTQPWVGLHHASSKLLLLFGGWHVIRHGRWFLSWIRRARPRGGASARAGASAG